MVEIQSTTYIVASSGIEATTTQVQGGTPEQSNEVISIEGVASSTSLPAGSGIAISNFVESFEGAERITNLLIRNPSNSTDEYVLVSDPSTYQSIVTFGVIGTSGTIESFYDRSRFFFESPHESDPNTERDISDSIEAFMLFSNANVFSYNFAVNTEGSTTVITDKGDTFSDAAQVTDNVLTNGNFEQALSNWTNYNDSFGRVSTVTSTDEWPWAKTYLPGGVSPQEGSRMLALSLVSADKGALINDALISKRLSSDSIDSFVFDVMVGRAPFSTYYGLSFNIQFFDGLSKVYEIKYLISGMEDMSDESIFDALDLYPVDSITLTPTPTEDVWTSYSANMAADIQKASFRFDKVRFILFAGTTYVDTNTEMVLDDIQINLNILPDQLGLTDGFAHVITTHPTASGGVPLTISGTEEITAEDLFGPEFTNTVPISGSRNVPENTSVAFHVTDSMSSLDTGNVDVWIDGEQVVNASTTVTGTTWPVATKNVISSREIAYEFFRSSVFNSGAIVTVSGELADLASVSNQTITDYQFQIIGSGSLTAIISGSADGDPPVISITYPTDLATQVSPDTSINWSITDEAAGVDASTVKLYLNGGLKVNGSSASGGSVSITANSGKGYDYVFQPSGPFSYGQTVTGTVEAYDLASTPNFTNTSFVFTITPDETLFITDFFLASGETTLLTSGTNLSVDVVDLTYGVASGTTYLTVDGATPSGLITTYSGVGPKRIIFSVPLEPLVDFRDDISVVVHAENQFPGSYPVVKEEEYTLRPGYEIVWPNKTEDAVGGPETTFSFIENVQVLVEAKNFAKYFGTGTEFFRFLTEDQPRRDLGAYIEANIKTADLSATIESNNPFFEYGKTMTIEIEAEDYEGNRLVFTHTFIIEPRPS